MRFITTLLIMFLSLGTFAQEGNNQISIGLDLGLPVGDFGKGYGIGFGGTAKGLYGLGDASQVGLTVGYVGFGAEESSIDASTGIIPILAVYRHHFDQLYVEPQIGVSVISSSVDLGGSFGEVSSSTTGFGWALGGGYLINQFDLSARYQSASANGGSLGFFAIRVGYNFSF